MVMKERFGFDREPQQIHQLTLHLEEWWHQRVIDEQELQMLLSNGLLEIETPCWLHEIKAAALSLRHKIPAQLLEEVKLPSCPAIPEVRWPRDWWQAFRARWFPAWWLKRHPVQYETRRGHRALDAVDLKVMAYHTDEVIQITPGRDPWVRLNIDAAAAATYRKQREER